MKKQQREMWRRQRFRGRFEQMSFKQLPQSRLDLQQGHKLLLELLHKKVGSLLEFLDNSDDEPMKDLQKKVIDLANKVEEKVESHIQRESQKTLLKTLQRVFHLPSKSHERLYKILLQAICDVDSIKERLIKLMKNNNLQAVNDSINGSSSPRLHVSTLVNDMVGYNIEQERMRSQLMGHSSQLEVISIVGMGGIGKSTFANKMFSDPSVLSFFDIRGWINVSKNYSLRRMLLTLLQDTVGVAKELDKKSDGDLADCLQKSLKGRRYLIVVDDIWSREAWDDVRLCFPENNNRSRILLTTRDMKVAQYASSLKDLFPMRFLQPKESWHLFCQKVFGQKDCPTEFENVAKEVVSNCKGLPLMISVVAGTLSSKKTMDEWIEVAQSVISSVDLDDYQHCSRVLGLSYNHLPSYLKACFLYFGVFPKASVISVKKLTRLWIAEGLLELKGSEGLEEVASNILHDLIDKSLVVVIKQSLDEKIKTCRIHDLLHDLCLREGESENLLYVACLGSTRVSSQDRWVAVNPERGYDSYALLENLTHSKIRSIHFHPTDLVRHQLSAKLFHFKLLRVLDLVTIRLVSFPIGVVHLISLRYLAVVVNFETSEHQSISNLWNLQTFIFSKSLPQINPVHLPNGIWEMSQLRLLHSTRMSLYPPPKVSANEVKYRVLENLRSVSGLSPCCCTKEIFEGIKNVRKLGISGTEDEFDYEPICLDNLIYLPELEELKIASYTLTRYDVLLRLPFAGSFPPNLKKLTLRKTFLLWEDMTIISKLPKLEVLQLKADAFVISYPVYTVWEVTEMGFLELKFLLLEWLDLDYWRAADDYFPCLEQIVIRNCRTLKEIPEGFADSLTLQQIQLHRCTSSLVTFAEQIQENYESLGNNMLKVYSFDTIRGRAS